MDERLCIGVIGGLRAIAIPDTGSLTIGRGKDCDVQVHDPLVSRRHALVHGGATPSFEDLGGKNPSSLLRGLVVERLAPSRRTPLARGDVIKLGAQLVGIHHRDSAVTRLEPDGEAFEARVAHACDAGEPFALIRIQLAHTTSADLARAALFGLLDGAEGVAHAILGIHDLALLANVAAPAANLEVQQLATQLSELGVQGVVGLASFPSDGVTAAAVFAAASTEVETIRAWAPATPIAIASERRPAPLTSFVGRADELAAICARLDAGARLLTLVGPPGAGKTRLALRHVELHAPHAVFCDLGGTHDVGAVRTAIAQALQLPAGRGIGDALAARGGLVVLDNVEHVAGVLRPELARWLAVARGAQFLVTSREVLGIAGEDTLELGPLGLPATDGDLDADAVRLFCERSRMVRGDVRGPLDHDVVTLVRRLDGMPLALELAAGCLDVYSPAELCARFPDRLIDLVDARCAPGGRHHSLRGALDQSWALLGEAERATLVAASVFEGGFSLAALEAVARAERSSIVAGLRKKSWIRGLERDGRRRFELYRSIRAYVETCGAERSACRRAHAAYFAGVAREALGPQRTDASACTAELEREIENLRAAHRAAATVDDALALALAIARVTRGEVEALVAAALQRPGTPDARLAIRARVVAALACHERGAPDDARARLAPLLALAEGDAYTEGLVQAALGRAIATSDPLASVPHFEAALPRLCPDPRARAIAAIDHASVRLALDDVGCVQELLDEAARDAERAGDHRLEVEAATELGKLFVATGRLAEAERLLRGAIARAGALGDAHAEAYAACCLGFVLQERGSHGDALAFYNRARELFARMDDRGSLARVVGAIGSLHHEQGDVVGARECYREAIDGLARAHARTALAVARCALGASLADLDERDDADAIFADVVAGELTDRHALLYRLARAHTDVARARHAERDGNAEAAAMWRSRAVAALESSARRIGPDVRCAQRLLRRVLPAAPDSAAPKAPVPTLFIAKHAHSLLLPSGERVDLSRHASLRLIVLGLARRRGAGMTHDELLACGWPGERVELHSGNARVRVALSRLRSLGLRDLLIRGDDGYALAPGVVVVVDDD